ncbi:MAG: O-methyltransferase [Bacteroidales bacterium]|nr:O-methyltransferase [Bacteroidales bacterium]
MTEAEREATLENYVLSHITPEDDYLYRLYRATNTQLLRPRMASGHLQGQLLRMLTRLIQPQVVVEIGTYSGYSALSMAAGMTAGSVIHTFEVNDEQEDFTRPWLEGSPYPARIELHIGDVCQLLPQMGLTVDLAFIDANKRQYVDYYELVMDCLRPGGYILADNTLWDGHVIDHAYDRDAQTIGIRRFNDVVAADERVEKVILPLRDGLTLIRKVGA